VVVGTLLKPMIVMEFRLAVESGQSGFWKIMLGKIKRDLEQGRSLMTFASLQAVGQTFGMVAPLVVAKAFSADLFGSYSLSKMIVFFFAAILVSASQAPFIVFASQERTQSGKINRAFTVQLMFFTLGLCVFAGLALPLSRQMMAFAGINAGDLLFVLLAFVGLAMEAFVCNLFMAMGERVRSSLVELVFGSSSLGFIIAFYLGGSISLRTVFLTYILSALVVLVTFIKAIDFRQLLPLKIDKRYMKDMLTFTKWIMLGATALYFVNWGDNLVLRYYKSMADIGAYNLGYQIFKGVVMLALIVNSYFLPFVSQHISDGPRMRDYLSRKRPRIFLVGVFCIALLFLAVPHIFNFYGGEYREAIAVLRVLLIGSVAVLHTVFYIPILNALKRYRVHQTINVLHVSLNLFLDLVLVPVMGLLGAAVATTIAYFCQAAMFEIYFRLRLRRLFWQ